jgi:hypothetical protein
MLARSQRISNRKLKEEGGWKPAIPSVRAGWPLVARQLAAANQLRPATYELRPTS